MAELKIRNVRKVYPNNVLAIETMSLDVADGEFIVLVGPSGCGKSTLLRMIAGLEEITAGEIQIGERVVNELEPADRDIAMVFQNYALYPHMSVYNNMAYGLRNRRTPAPEVDRRVRDAAKLLEIEMLLERRPRQLSGGQRQRVAMGRAIVRRPSVFLFDEPLSNLDAKLRVQMRIEIRHLQNRLKTTSVYVTHDQVEAMTLADRLVVMNGGAAEQIGTAPEVYAKPATTFVAGFIGSPAMNLISGRVEDGGTVLAAEGGVKLRLPAARTGLQGRNIQLGVRPEDLVPCAESEASMVAEIDLIEPLGAETLVYGHIGSGAASARITVRLHATIAAAQGRLALRFADSAVHLFDSESGRRIEA